MKKYTFDICPNSALIEQKDETIPKCRMTCRICNGSGIIAGKVLEYVNLKYLTHCNALEMVRATVVGCIYCGVLYRTKGLDLSIDGNCSIQCIKCGNADLITSANPMGFELSMEAIRDLKRYWYG